jgi:hypothetical protein
MKQLLTLLLLLPTGQPLLAQEIKVPTHVCSITFYCNCEHRDGRDHDLPQNYEAANDSTRAIYHSMHSRQTNGNNNSANQPPETKSYYHLKNGSFYLED